MRPNFLDEALDCNFVLFSVKYSMHVLPMLEDNLIIKNSEIVSYYFFETLTVFSFFLTFELISLSETWCKFILREFCACVVVARLPLKHQIIEDNRRSDQRILKTEPPLSSLPLSLFVKQVVRYPARRDVTYSFIICHRSLVMAN